jgi:hypothetical protein
MAIYLFDIWLLIDFQRTGSRSPDIYVDNNWGYFRIIEVGQVGPWPNLQQDDQWQIKGRSIVLRGLDEQLQGPNTDGPEHWIKVSLGNKRTFGQFIDSLKSLERLGLCNVALREQSYKESSGESVGVWGIASSRPGGCQHEK